MVNSILVISQMKQGLNAISEQINDRESRCRGENDNVKEVFLKPLSVYYSYSHR